MKRVFEFPGRTKITLNIDFEKHSWSVEVTAVAEDKPAVEESPICDASTQVSDE